MSTQAATTALRSLIEQRFPDATPITHRTTDQVATGIAALDRALPSGGFPRGRLSVWAPQGGATAILRAACYSTAALGERSAWIDGKASLLGQNWTDGPVLLRPRTRLHGLRAAEEVLRSGGFSLVVLTGIDPVGNEAVRLSRAAREGGAAFITLTRYSALSSLRLTSRIDPESYRWLRTPFDEPAVVRDVTVAVRARAMGWNAQSTIRIPVVHHELRLAVETGLVDRRGVH